MPLSKADQKAVANLKAHVRYAGVALLFTGAVSGVLLAAAGHLILALAAALLALVGAMTALGIRRFVDGSPQRTAQLVRALRRPVVAAMPAILILIASLGMLAARVEAGITLRLIPLLAWLWLTGAGFSILYPLRPDQGSQDLPSGGGNRLWLPLLGLGLCIAIAALPSRLPSLLDGLPWDTPVEFLFVLLLLPLAFALGRISFGSKPVLVALAVLFAAKCAAAVLLPQAGLGIRESFPTQGQPGSPWTRMYASMLRPGYSDVMTGPYSSYREFPIEWINRAGFDPAAFRADFTISAYGHLQPGERIVFLLQGVKDARIDLVDAASGRRIPATMVSDASQLNGDLYQQLPALSGFRIEGQFGLRRLSQARFEPILLSPSGTYRSALHAPGLWLSPAGITYDSGQASLLRDGLQGLSLVLIGLVAFILLRSICDDFRRGSITSADLFLAASAPLALVAAALTSKPQFNLLVLAVVALIGAVKVADATAHPEHRSRRGFLLAMALPFLLALAFLELDSLRSVTIFPQGQDGLEYQALARSIFVNGDPLLLQSPPRAYKVLFPYLVGGLHVLFGQSTSAQFFLSAWTAVLSSLLVFALLRKQVTGAVAVAGGVVLAVIICAADYIFYFRFGLIEPVAITMLLLTCWLAAERRLVGTFIAGAITVLLRLDYLLVTFAALVLTAEPITGAMRASWQEFTSWLRTQIRVVTLYAIVLVVPPVLITLGYALSTRGYVVSAADTRQTSLASAVESLARVALGGNFTQLAQRLTEDPFYLVLVTLPLLAGLVIALAALLYRRGVFERIDLRWALLLLSTLPIYVLVRPTGYAPRFSLPLLPFDLILLGLLLHLLFPARLSSA